MVQFLGHSLGHLHILSMRPYLGHLHGISMDLHHGLRMVLGLALSIAPLAHFVDPHLAWSWSVDLAVVYLATATNR
ncbi:hypothetical protein HPB52_023285 [Rhipicephalus sanguineus]|uniref:Uncharacterized protein n=1 Tax=Rhipicephalus sanguineus TaxID=34632 RepID=A0A9D4YR21_RHISA|nr:hypothetical protein HPB52_023285 [Rhipicephalus sanguineus]